jgi:hypothetical protein
MRPRVLSSWAPGTCPTSPVRSAIWLRTPAAQTDRLAVMIWLFERGDRVVQLVTRFDTDSGEYVLEMQWSDGLSETERFRDYGRFKDRILGLERQLAAEEWKQAGASPQFISGDWWKP